MNFSGTIIIMEDKIINNRIICFESIYNEDNYQKIFQPCEVLGFIIKHFIVQQHIF